MDILSSASSFLSTSVENSLRWLGEKFHLTPKEFDSVKDKLETVAKTSEQQRQSLAGNVLGRGWTLMGDTLKYLAQGNETLGDIAIIAERLWENPAHKSMIDDFKLGYMILEKIPFLGSWVEALIAKLPYFVELAEKIDPAIAARIRDGDGEATSQMVQKILALLEIVNNQIQYTTVNEKIAENPDTSAAHQREGLFEQILGRAWRGAVDYLKIMAQGNETMGDVAILAEQLTEGKDTKTVADSLKMVYLVLEKVPLLGSTMESVLPKMPYFMDFARKLDPTLAKKIEEGDGEATSQIVQKMLGSLELVLNQLSYNK